MCAGLSNHSCTFCNPGQWVARKSVPSVRARWGREQPWSSSPWGSVIIWAALRWELGICRPPRSTSSAHLGPAWKKTNLNLPEVLLFLFPLWFLTPITVNVKVPDPSTRANPSPPLSLIIFFSLVVRPSWNFSLLHLSSDPTLSCLSSAPLSSSFPTQSRGSCLSVLFHETLPSHSFNSIFLFFFCPTPQCIDCKSDLGGTEAGAEVRIRNKQLYCNTCYMRFKSECSLHKIDTSTCHLLSLWL